MSDAPPNAALRSTGPAYRVRYRVAPSVLHTPNVHAEDEVGDGSCTQVGPVCGAPHGIG